MPCRSWEEDDIKVFANDQNRELSEKIHKLTQLLCQACYLMENSKDERLSYLLNDTDYNYEELRIWWQEHKRKDRERAEAEAKAMLLEKRRAHEELERDKAMKRVLAKLTPEEKKLLGIEYRV